VDARLWEGSKIITGSPTPPDLTTSLWYHLGCVQARLGNFSQACDAMEAAAALLSTHPIIMHELAKCFQATGRFADAVDRFDRVLEQQPRNARAQFRRGLALKSLKRYDEAAADMEVGLGRVHLGSRTRTLV
jgi:tetratricopeptide (TPR) repeat protein